MKELRRHPIVPCDDDKLLLDLDISPFQDSIARMGQVTEDGEVRRNDKRKTREQDIITVTVLRNRLELPV